MEVGGLKMAETELSLGLGLGLGLGLAPGSGVAEKEEVVVVKSNKRGFSETMDLKLNLTSNNNNGMNNDKDNSGENEESATSSPLDLMKMKSDQKVTAAPAAVTKEISSKVTAADPAKPPAKAQVVGWPPVRSYRKNVMAVQKTTGGAEAEADKQSLSGGLVKVSMDGAPYLRKVDFKMYKSYQDLSAALGKMFSSFTLGNYGAQGMIDFMNESKLMDLLNDADYVPTYEDKDGDWMLVGDVPWEMFVESCKRLRIMKGKEAAGLAPRAMEKCKNRN